MLRGMLLYYFPATVFLDCVHCDLWVNHPLYCGDYRNFKALNELNISDHHVQRISIKVAIKHCKILFNCHDVPTVSFSPFCLEWVL